jgi:hypothetical protein
VVGERGIIPRDAMCNRLHHFFINDDIIVSTIERKKDSLFSLSSINTSSTRGELVKMSKTKYHPILMKLGDLVGISFIKLNLNFHVKILIRIFCFCNLLENWGY